MRVSLSLENSAEICVAVRKLVESGDLEGGCSATLVVLVFLMRVAPCQRARISLHDDHMCMRAWLPACSCMSIDTTYTGGYNNCCRVMWLLACWACSQGQS